jgi:hypothetical protein
MNRKFGTGPHFEPAAVAILALGTTIKGDLYLCTSLEADSIKIPPGST